MPIHEPARQGGPRTGSGRPARHKDIVRSQMLRLCITETEREVLDLLAKQWSVPTATAAYGLLADAISTCRKSAATSIPADLVYAASQLIARHKKVKGDREATRDSQP